MECCRWDFEDWQLADSAPGQLWDPSPIMLLELSDSPPHEAQVYSMPVYKTSKRESDVSTSGHTNNYIMSIELPTNVKPIYWILKSAAFICQPDY